MIDVLVTSTCRKQFETTYRSFIEHVRCAEGFRFVVNVDVLENKRYLPRLIAFLKEHGIDDVRIVTKNSSFAGAVNHVVENVRSEFYFYLEDDWLFLKPIDLDAVLRVMREHPEVHQIRFSKEKIVKPGARQLSELEKTGEMYLAPGKQVEIGGMELVGTAIWSLNPHVARTAAVRQCGRIPEGKNPEAFLCKSYAQTFPNPGLYIYGAYGDSAAVRDIGRPHILLRKLRTILAILKNPTLINKETRMKKVLDRLGR